MLPRLLAIAALREEHDRTFLIPGADVRLADGTLREVDLFGTCNSAVVAGEAKTSPVGFRRHRRRHRTLRRSRSLRTPDGRNRRNRLWDGRTSPPDRAWRLTHVKESSLGHFISSGGEASLAATAWRYVAVDVFAETFQGRWRAVRVGGHVSACSVVWVFAETFQQPAANNSG